MPELIHIHFLHSRVSLAVFAALSSPSPSLPSPLSLPEYSPRAGRCRRCARHGVYSEVKGHKWYCPYKAPPGVCTECGVTRPPQQTQTLNDAAAGLPAAPRPFPRMQELRQETEHILDEDLFRRIDEYLQRSRSAAHRGADPRRRPH
ncbi:uncharacterized protein LOC127005722 [Eriocheir sinensis]|uniref:uncharacterized protein LOC127005722 n=1 Tax=Eriocheir sinensis TaxID=95602 RepID=UPI0021C80C79|nr:uncharacterized protein LOC127005722 [Eriocheir sinensis]